MTPTVDAHRAAGPRPSFGRRKRRLMEGGEGLALPEEETLAKIRRLPESARAFAGSSREEARRTNDRERGDSR